MSAPFNLFAERRYSHLAGTSGTATVPAKGLVSSISCVSTAGGTIVITPNGATALPTITVPAGVAFEIPWLSLLGGGLNAGTTIVFASTDSYYVGIALGMA